MQFLKENPNVSHALLHFAHLSGMAAENDLLAVERTACSQAGLDVEVNNSTAEDSV